MFLSFRLATLFYALTVFTVGYVAASTIHDLWTQADEMQARYEVMSYDAVTPSTGAM